MASQGARAASSGIDGLTVSIQGIKEIEQMFNQLPRQVNKTLIWGRFWKKVTVPLLEAARQEAPLLDPKTNWSIMRPSDFSIMSQNLKLTNGTKLSNCEEKLI